jgi:alkanesulfonate monooxygenase SsuD/methylene tetrahydromethanopterin reductase-like flavin-dependent oxidoreductase (luciferase family)
MDVLAEQLEIVHRSWEPGPFSFKGEHFEIEELDALPKPVQEPHPPLIAGGGAYPRGAALAARWCDEYNVLYLTPDEVAEKRDVIQAACRDAGRDPSTMGLSMMNAVIVGSDRDAVQRRLDMLGERRDPWIVGRPDEVVERLREYERAGIQRLFLQHLAHRDFDMLELFAAEVIPALRA